MTVACRVPRKKVFWEKDHPEKVKASMLEALRRKPKLHAMQCKKKTQKDLSKSGYHAVDASGEVGKASGIERVVIHPKMEAIVTSAGD